LTKKEKWELCKPILLNNEWTQEEIDNASSKTKSEVIAAVNDYLERKNKEQFEQCMKALSLTTAQYTYLAQQLDFVNSEYELEELLNAVKLIDKEQIMMFYNILGEEKFKKCFCDLS
jgi:hypothetical protein